MFGKAKRAKAILEKMISMYEAGTSQARPNVFTYTAVINTCAFTVGDDTEKANAMSIATNTFDELSSSDYGEPNHVTYVAYLSALRNLLENSDETRTALLSSIFCKCCADGQVSELTLRRLESALTAEQVRKVYHSAGFEGGPQIAIRKVPAEWRRNVIEEKKTSGKNQRNRRR